jgi:hypothetical protein
MIFRGELTRCTWPLVLAAALLAGCATTPPKPPVTVDQVVQMSQDQVPAADIIAKMQEAGTVYRLSGSQLAKLKEQGVPDEVLDYMQSTYLAYAERQAVSRYDPYFWGPYWGPYPYWYWGPPGFYGPPYWRYPYRYPYYRRR